MTMKNRLKKQQKGVRVIVRMGKDDGDWLQQAALRTDSSVSRIVRAGIRLLREREANGQMSFDFAGRHQFSFAN